MSVSHMSVNVVPKKKKVSEDKRMVDTKESLKARMNLQVMCVCVCVCVCVSKVCVCVCFKSVRVCVAK